MIKSEGDDWNDKGEEDDWTGFFLHPYHSFPIYSSNPSFFQTYLPLDPFHGERDGENIDIEKHFGALHMGNAKENPSVLWVPPKKEDPCCLPTHPSTFLTFSPRVLVPADLDQLVPCFSLVSS